jgi:polar amino acid transport system substrate-binding protein
MRDTVQGVIAQEEGVLKENVLEFGTQEEALSALRDGKIDAYAATTLGHRTILAKLASDDLELAEGFQPPRQGGRPAAGFGAYSFAKSDAAFVARFNEALASVLGSAEHRAMLSRLGFTDAEIDPAIAMRGRLSELCG